MNSLMKTLSSFGSIQSSYEIHVNKEKKIVTCIKRNLRNEIESLYHRKMFDCEYLIVFAKDIPDKIIAMVKCADEDVFDPEVGKKLVIKKMDAKVHRMIYKVYGDVCTHLYKELNEMERVALKYYTPTLESISDAEITDIEETPKTV